MKKLNCLLFAVAMVLIAACSPQDDGPVEDPLNTPPPLEKKSKR